MKITLTKPQHLISSSNKRFRVLISGRRFGKTYLAITEMMKYAAIPNQRIWYVAPTFKMAKEIVWSSLKEILKGYGNWSYDMYLKGKQDPEWDSFQFTTLQGGMVTPKELEQARQDLDQRTFRQEFEGTFENYAGAIYYNFHPVESVIQRKIDWTKPLHIGMDFNIDPMSACVAQIEKEKIYLLDEIVIYSSNTDEMVQEIRDRYGTKIPIFIYPDPASRQRKTSAGGRTDLSILQNGGFTVKVKHKHPAVRDRINAVNSKLKDSKGVRHIFISNSCKYLIKGLQRQTYKEDTNIPDKEDGFDHMNDALGYMIDYIKPLVTQMPSSLPTRWNIK
jgi:phage terminase large subunit